MFQRQDLAPIGNVMGNPDEIRLNFRLALDEAGRPFVRLAAAAFDAYLDGAGARHSRAV